MTVVSDSGPLIHLSIVNQFSLLKQFFHRIFIVPQVYEEVVVQGKGRPGAGELLQAIQEGWIIIESTPDSVLMRRFLIPSISQTDATVIASAFEKKTSLLLTDDSVIRRLAAREGVSVLGSIGILTQARLQGIIAKLKPILDHLVASGFHLDPHGQVYKDVLKLAGERE